MMQRRFNAIQVQICSVRCVVNIRLTVIAIAIQLLTSILEGGCSTQGRKDRARYRIWGLGLKPGIRGHVESWVFGFYANWTTKHFKWIQVPVPVCLKI